MFSRCLIEPLESRQLFSNAALADTAAAVSGRPIPVLVVPGLFGSLPTDSSAPGLLKFLRGKKAANPTSLQPAGTTYDTLLADLTARPGYVRDQNVFFAAYDWREPVAPHDHANDGIIKLAGGFKFNDKTFKYGIQYLQYWIDRAKTSWVTQYGDAIGFEVDVVAHSMGGVIARALIQSNYYTKNEPGVVHDLELVATPNEGAVSAAIGRNATFGDELFSGADLPSDGSLAADLAPLVVLLYNVKVHSVIKSIDDLLPTFNYSTNVKAPRSRVLTDLDADVSRTATGAQTVDVVYGSGTATEAFVNADGTSTSADGDGTVLVSSASLPGLGTAHEFSGLTHVGLVTDPASAAAITSLLSD